MQLIRDFIVDVFDPSIDEDFEAVDARGVGDVDRRILDAGAVFGRLRDRVHFRMDGAEAILLGIPVRGFGLVDETADVNAMGHSRRRAVVARGQDVFVAHDHGAHLRALTSGALCYLARDRHEILVPAQSSAHAVPPWTFASTKGAEVVGFGWNCSRRTLGSWIEKGMGMKVAARMTSISHPINFLLGSSGV